MPTSNYYRLLARLRLKGQWGTAILVSLVAGLLSGDLLSFNFNIIDGYTSIFGAEGFLADYASSLASIPAPIYVGLLLASLLLAGIVRLGRCSYYIQLVRGGRPGFDTLFSMATFWGKAVLLNLYISLLTLLWSLLFVIPGIVAAYRYSLAFYILADDPSKGVMECVADSKMLMHGHKWRLFCLDFSFIGWRLLCVLTLGVGYLFLAPYEDAARGQFYIERTGTAFTTAAPEGNYKVEEPEFVINTPEQL